MSRRLARPVLVICTALGLLASVYLLVGFYTLIIDTRFSEPVDLRLRWIEQQMVVRGQNPQELKYPEHLLPERILGMGNVRGSYPPWSYATGLFLVPPIDWTLTRVYFAFLNVMAIGAVGCWAYSCGERATKGWGLVAIVSLLATFSISVCLSYGQYPVLVLAFVVGYYVLLDRRHMALAGVVFGLAMLKPQLAGLSFLIPAIYPFRGRDKAWFYVGAASYLALTSWGVSAFVNASPIEMLRGTTTESVKSYLLSSNALIILSADLFGFSIGSKLLAIVTAGVCAVCLYALRRNGSLLAAFSVCIIFAMFWSYRRHYDDLLLVIPLLELLWLWRTRRSTSAATAFFVLGILLWAPIRIQMAKWPVIQVSYAAACALALATIIALETRVWPQPTRDSKRWSSTTR
jgi:hypothetical protein